MQRQTSSRLRRLTARGAGALALALLLPLTARAQIVQPLCRNVPNGDFQNGFSGWTQDPCIGGFSDFNGFVSATIEDLTSIGCDANVACLNLSVDATWNCDKPSAAAGQAQISISRTAEVTGRFLTFKVFGGFEFFQFAMADIKYDALVVVTNQDGEMVKCPVLSWNADGIFDCPAGIQALGAIQLETICCDLAAGGIVVGDTVTIEVIWSATVVACEDCDSGLFFGSFCVDEFRFCAGCLAPNPHMPVDGVLSVLPATSPSTAVSPFAGAPGAQMEALRHLVHLESEIPIDLVPPDAEATEDS